MIKTPLSGITVVALEQAVAAPFATRQLADWGARVIKVERPGTGDFARHYDEAVHGLSSHFVWINRGKESLTLNLKSPEGLRVLAALLEKADVLVQNLKPGALEHLGLPVETLRQRYPKLIVCSISGYGPDGPYRDRKAYDLLIQAESGLLSITGTQEAPAKVGLAVADVAAGMYALNGILLALFERVSTGQGTVLDVSMLEALGEWMGHPLNYGHFSGRSPARTGARHATIAPYGPYRVARGEEIFLAVQNDREWQAFSREVLEKPRLAADPRFADNSGRLHHQESMNAEIDAVLSRMTAEEAMERLDQAQIAYARMNSLDQVWEHPQLRARERFRPVATEAGAIEAMLPPVNFREGEPAMGAVPALGAHTESILQEL